MKTYKPLSTISYNTSDFLKLKLDKLISDEIISFYSFLSHHGEHGKKDHIHVYIEPCRVIDTNSQAWKCFLIQSTADGELSCMPWQKSNFENWVLYTRHDESYLSAKKLKKQYVNYPYSAFVSSDNTSFLGKLDEVNVDSYKSPIENMVDCMESGMNVIEAMRVMRVPVGAMHSFCTTWERVKSIKEKLQ